MNCNLRKRSVKEYASWTKDSRKRDASLPNFFGSGEARTMNYCNNPTYKQAIALRNWGIDAPLKGLKK